MSTTSSTTSGTTGSTFDPWWGERAVADAERERQARQEDRREAQEFQAALDAARKAGR